MVAVLPMVTREKVKVSKSTPPEAMMKGVPPGTQPVSVGRLVPFRTPPGGPDAVMCACLDVLVAGVEHQILARERNDLRFHVAAHLTREQLTLVCHGYGCRLDKGDEPLVTAASAAAS